MGMTTSMGSRVVRAIAVAALVLGASSCGAGDDEVEVEEAVTLPASTGLITLHLVTEETSSPCHGRDTVSDPEPKADGCLVLGPALIDDTDVEAARLEVSTAGDDLVFVFMQLNAAASKVLDTTAAANLGERLAILHNGTPIVAPTVNAVEYDGQMGFDLPHDEAVDLVKALGFDATVPDRSSDDELQTRAGAVCSAYGEEHGLEQGVWMATTAGDIEQQYGASIAPWNSLPASHFVASCSYTDPDASAPTTICPDGDTYSLSEPVQVLVDESGRSTPAPSVAPLDTSDCPSFEE